MPPGPRSTTRHRPRSASCLGRPQARRLHRAPRLGDSSVRPGGRRPCREPLRTALPGSRRQVQPLVELRTPFARRADRARRHRPGRLRRRPRRVDRGRPHAAMAEDQLVFHGFGGCRDRSVVVEASPHDADRHQRRLRALPVPRGPGRRTAPGRRRRRALRHRPRPPLLHGRDRSSRDGRLPGPQAPRAHPGRPGHLGARRRRRRGASASAAATSSSSVGQDFSIGYLHHDAATCTSTSRRASPSASAPPRRPSTSPTPRPSRRPAPPEFAPIGARARIVVSRRPRARFSACAGAFPFRRHKRRVARAHLHSQSQRDPACLVRRRRRGPGPRPPGHRGGPRSCVASTSPSSPRTSTPVTT